MHSYGLSPLRYPGGKSLLTNFLSELIELNGAKGGTYYELYAGGAGAALNLLFGDIVNEIVINDADYRIYSFWHSIINQTKKFLKAIDECDVNIDEWNYQKEIYANAKNENTFDVGFATFFLNRTNRSGIIHNAGPIGGLKQTGNYLIDVRFNKDGLKKRIEAIASKKERIKLYNLKTENFVQDTSLYKNTKKSFFYLDPPYYYKGSELYLNNYSHDQHKNLSLLLCGSKIKNWLVSYDNVIEIKNMYKNYRTSKFNLNYSLQVKKEASELLIFSNSLKIPQQLTIRTKAYDLTKG